MAGDLDGQAEEIAELYYEHAVGTLGAEDLTGFSLAILGSAMRMSSSLASFVATGSEENVPATTFLEEAIKLSPLDAAINHGVISIAAAILGCGSNLDQNLVDGVLDVVKRVLAVEGADASV